MTISIVILILVNILFSHRGFTNFMFFERYKLNVGEILYSKQFERMLSSSFLHKDWSHLLFNMFILLLFAPVVIDYTSETYFLILYFLSVLGGSFLSLLLNKSKSYHSQVGASGGVIGVMFASICLFPQEIIRFFFISMPAWVFAIVCLSYSLFGTKQFENVGYEMHIGGAFLGILTIFAYHPFSLITNFWYILPMLFLILYFSYKSFF